MKFLLTTLTFLNLVVLFYGCTIARDLELTEVSPSDTSDGPLFDISFYDTSSDVYLSDIEDIYQDQEDDTGVVIKCGENEGCNSYIEDNYCNGECILQQNTCECDGEIINGLCYLLDLPPRPEFDDIIDGIKIIPPSIPEKIFVGDILELKLALINTENRTKRIKIHYKNLQEWEISPQNFSNDSVLLFNPYEEKDLLFNAYALQTNVFLIGYKPIISLLFTASGNDINYEIYGDVLFNSNYDYIHCRNEYFPPTYCERGDCSSYSRYSFAVCCQDIFYPASDCCSDADCGIGGKCFDGRCVVKSPALFAANTTLLQNNRILIILSDIESIPENDLCNDKADQLRDLLQLDIIENYYKKIIYDRTKRTDILHLRWEVLAGFRSENFIYDEDYTFANFKRSLRNYLNDLGCSRDFNEYDKLIIISPKMDLYGFGGIAFGYGDIGQNIYENGYLTAHELAHTFGATDLYLELGGRFQYALTLMAGNFYNGFPQDKVTWGEIGLGDTNSNGVIDLFEFARFPEEIVVENLKAYLTKKESLEIGFNLMLLEGGIKKRGIFLNNTIELPDYNLVQDLYQETTIAFDRYQVDLYRIRQEQKIRARLKTSYRYTNREFKNVVLNYDKIFDVPVALSE